MAGLGFRGLNERPIENPGAFPSNGAQPGRLIEVPGTSYEVTDVLTTIPVSVALGKFSSLRLSSHSKSLRRSWVITPRITVVRTCRSKT